MYFSIYINLKSYCKELYINVIFCLAILLFHVLVYRFSSEIFNQNINPDINQFSQEISGQVGEKEIRLVITYIFIPFPII